MTGLTRVSVVIPTYQRCASVRRTLEALARQTIAATEYEVIVTIDGSDDGTREMVEAFQPQYLLRALWQPNQGRAAARNAGLRLAQGDIVVFLDDDMEPVPDFLLAHVDAHPPGSRRAVVGPVPILVDSASSPIVHYRRSGMNAHLDRLAQPGYQLGFRDMYSGNLSLPREVLCEIGGFDENFKLYGHEDYELALRLSQVGVELGYNSQAVAYQYYEKDFAGLARDCLARGHTAVLFARKHPDVASSPKLATYRAGSPVWRLLRSLMLGLSRWFPGFPERLIGSMTWLERRNPPRLHVCYKLVLDYFFWLGATSALRQPERTDFQRLRIGIRALVLFVLGSNVLLLARGFHQLANAARPDEITRYEARFQELRRVVPSHARVGYISGIIPEGAANGEAARLAFKRYLLTQYALLPTIVLPDHRESLVVGNFDSVYRGDSRPARDLALVQDFGDGVMLFRPSDK